MATARTLTDVELEKLAEPVDNVYLWNLIAYANALGQAGLDSRQIYSRHARVCNEIERELGLVE